MSDTKLLVTPEWLDAHRDEYVTARSAAQRLGVRVELLEGLIEGHKVPGVRYEPEGRRLPLYFVERNFYETIKQTVRTKAP